MESMTGRLGATQANDDAPERYHCPDTLQQQESPLVFLKRKDSEDRGTHQIEQQTGVRAWVEQTELNQSKGCENQQSAHDLDSLAHDRPRRHPRTPRPTPISPSATARSLERLAPVRRSSHGSSARKPVTL